MQSPDKIYFASEINCIFSTINIITYEYHNNDVAFCRTPAHDHNKYPNR